MNVFKRLATAAAVVVFALLSFCVITIFRDPAPDIDAETAARLSDIADQWCETYGSGDRSVPFEVWPEDVRGLDPEYVYASPDGVHITTGEFFVEAWGVFVLRSGSAFVPQQYTDPSYRKLRDRVYWFEIKG